MLAVPGEAGRPLSAGPHKLLRDGAHLCESPDDVLALLPATAWSTLLRAPGRPADGARSGAGGSERDAPKEGRSVDDAAHDPGGGPEGRVLAALQRGRHTADQLGRALDLAPQAVSAAR